MTDASRTPVIKNRRATFEFHVVERFVAGIVLTGTEVKSIRSGKANLNEAYCFFKKDELWIKNMHISEYSHGSIHNHDPLRMRKLLLNKRELKRLLAKVKERGLTIIPLELHFSERGLAKLEIGLAKGKKTHDKRQSIKERDTKRELQRMTKR